MFDGQERLIPPASCPATSRLYNWLPTRGAQIDIKTTSFYAARSLGGQPQADVRPRACATSACAARRPATSSAPTPTRVVPRLAATYDAQGRRPLGGPGRPTPTTPASTARRSSPATPTSATRAWSSLRVHRSGRPGPRLRARASTRRTTRDHRRQLPDRQRVLRRRPALAGEHGVHGVAAAAEISARAAT